jgi:hypothetical protein
VSETVARHRAAKRHWFMLSVGLSATQRDHERGY